MAGFQNSLGDSGTILGIVVGGDKNDPNNFDEGHGSLLRIMSPTEHGSEVDPSHIALSPMSHSPTGFSQNSFQGALDPGSLVYFSKSLGQNQVNILGQANDTLGGEAGGGNLGSLMNGVYHWC